MQTKKAYLYIRVSTDEQADKGFSLQYQEDSLKRFCQIHGYEIAGLYKEDYSAKTFNRPVFKQLLPVLKKNRKENSLLLFTKWDRFSRNAPEAYGMISQLNKLGVDPQASEQPLDMSIPESRIMLAFYLSAPDADNARRALNVSTTMRNIKKGGRWVSTAPKGFKNIRYENKKATIIPNEDAKHVVWVFEEIAKGVLSADEVRQLANKRGFVVSRSYFWTMIRNPLYCGKIFVPAFKDEEAYYENSVHESLISQELFYRVQNILDGKKRAANVNTLQQEELPLRGFLVCSKCGSRLTGSASKGKLLRYYYYHCQHGCKERYRADIANREAIRELQEVSAKKEVFQLYKVILEKELKKTSKEVCDDNRKVVAEINKHKERIANAETLMLDREIDLSEYKAIKGRYEANIRQLETEMQNDTPRRSDYIKYLDFGFNILQNVDTIYTGSNAELKKQILCSIYSEKLVFDGIKYRTPVYHEALALILNADKGFSRNEKGQSHNNLTLSSGVARTGFEPVSPP